MSNITLALNMSARCTWMPDCVVLAHVRGTGGSHDRENQVMLLMTPPVKSGERHTWPAFFFLIPFCTLHSRYKITNSFWEVFTSAGDRLSWLHLATVSSESLRHRDKYWDKKPQTERTVKFTLGQSAPACSRKQIIEMSGACFDILSCYSPACCPLTEQRTIFGQSKGLANYRQHKYVIYPSYTSTLMNIFWGDLLNIFNSSVSTKWWRKERHNSQQLPSFKLL